MSTPADPAADALDRLERLPKRNWLSFALVLTVQALNAFNDNFVKMLLISLAITVAGGTALGGNIEMWLGAIFAVPYILFAPVAGWISDRCSKQRVMMWMQVLQLACFGFFAWVLTFKSVPLSLWLSLIGFFVLAAQSAFFSPAKMGVMKELVGSRRLGMAAGLLQMTMLVGVLAGMWAGAAWYGALLDQTRDPWHSALWPLLLIGALAIGELVASLLVQRTAEQTSERFKPSLLWEHFSHLGLLYGPRPLRLAALGVNYFWFISNALSFVLVSLSKELHPAAKSGAGPMELARVAAILGVGVILGSLIASSVCKRRIELGMVAVGGFGLVAGLLISGLAPAGSGWMYAGLVFTGAAGGCFMVPLYAFIQDRAAPEERARVLAALNLTDCLVTFVAVGVVAALRALGLGAPWQFVVLAVPTFFAALYVMRVVPADFLRLLAMALVRSIYKLKAVNPRNLPATGGVLLLPNHVSYVDALITGSACERQVRFVMWDVLYRVWWLNWIMRIMGTVPISSTRAKDAVRAVVAALKEGDAVCVFPEGQLTRHGMINEVRKGYELMARQAGVPVLPVYINGLFGSVFSYEGGIAFKKWPKKLRYPVSVHFGQLMQPREATPDSLRRQWYELSREALFMRSEFKGAITDLQPLTNALRLLDIEWMRPGETLLVLAPEGSVLDRTAVLYHTHRRGIGLTRDMGTLSAAATGTVVAIGGAGEFSRLGDSPGWSAAGRMAMYWDAAEAQPPGGVAHMYRGLLDPATGALLATCLCDPAMPAAEAGLQHGTREGSFGRLLTGLTIAASETVIEIGGLAPGTSTVVRLQGITLDEEGFLVPINEAASPVGKAAAVGPAIAPNQSAEGEKQTDTGAAVG